MRPLLSIVYTLRIGCVNTRPTLYARNFSVAFVISFQSTMHYISTQKTGMSIDDFFKGCDYERCLGSLFGPENQSKTPQHPSSCFCLNCMGFLSENDPDFWEKIREYTEFMKNNKENINPQIYSRHKGIFEYLKENHGVDLIFSRKFRRESNILPRLNKEVYQPPKASGFVLVPRRKW